MTVIPIDVVAPFAAVNRVVSPISKNEIMSAKTEETLSTIGRSFNTVVAGGTREDMVSWAELMIILGLDRQEARRNEINGVSIDHIRRRRHAICPFFGPVDKVVFLRGLGVSPVGLNRRRGVPRTLKGIKNAIVDEDPLLAEMLDNPDIVGRIIKVHQGILDPDRVLCRIKIVNPSSNLLVALCHPRKNESVRPVATKQMVPEPGGVSITIVASHAKIEGVVAPVSIGMSLELLWQRRPIPKRMDSIITAASRY
ncbi:hypothetical protein TW83_16470 [Paracoccus sp. S4493]|nr:hypothetical protein TW83_16470 [Paracoccus sp. S4493]